MTTLELKAVTKSYGSRTVLGGFSADFEQGRVAAIVGENGAGKTTLLRIIARLQYQDTGTVEGAHALYYGGADALPMRGRVNQLRRSLGLERVPDGERKLTHLSRGELQRAGLDVALDLAPAVLLLDEPWTGLEPDARDELSERLRAIANNRIILCSSHDLDEVARLADDVVFLANGVGTWRRREQGLDREDLIRLYRQLKRP